MKMLSKAKNVRIHPKDCFCCSDGFLESTSNKMSRRINRHIEKRDFQKEIQEYF